MSLTDRASGTGVAAALTAGGIGKDHTAVSGTHDRSDYRVSNAVEVFPPGVVFTSLRRHDDSPFLRFK